jgi:hypothetical protein
MLEAVLSGPDALAVEPDEDDEEFMEIICAGGLQ